MPFQKNVFVLFFCWYLFWNTEKKIRSHIILIIFQSTVQPQSGVTGFKNGSKLMCSENDHFQVKIHTCFFQGYILSDNSEKATVAFMTSERQFSMNMYHFQFPWLKMLRAPQGCRQEGERLCALTSMSLLVKVRSVRAAGSLDRGPYSGGLKKTILGPNPWGQHANSNPWVKAIERINVLTLLLLPMTVNVHAYMHHMRFFSYNEIHS